MGSVHQLAEERYVIILQCLYCLDSPLVLINRMLCSSLTHLALNSVLVGLEGFLAKLA